jgi:putative acyl-CoA dehydrogenase
MRDPAATHEVFNQPPPLDGINCFTQDAALVEALERHGAGHARARLEALGAWVLDPETQHLARLANIHPPTLHTHDAHGERIDEVDYHPAYHALLGHAVAAGIHSLPFAEPRAGAHVARAAAAFLFNHAEVGVLCPATMTFAGVPCLRQQPDIAADWENRVLSDSYDRRFIPAANKTGAMLGMAMTEKQGGSDVRANTTRAVPVAGGGPGGEYRLTGHKWFCSAPMSDAFLTLAQAPGGIACFLVPRFLPDGGRNVFLIQRLKDKLGNRSNASAEIEYRDTFAQLVGEEGRGVRTIIEMVHHTRLDTAISSAGIMRDAVMRAAHHAAHRTVFQKKLADQPAMRRVLADLIVESEAATALVMRIAAAFDAGDADPAERLFARAAVAAAKFWICKRVTPLVAEALEVHGGNGYVEDWPLARLYREAPLNGIWEGTGNVMALDVLRALAREPEAAEVLRAELSQARGADPRLDAHLDSTEALLGEGGEADARRIAAMLALALQGALLVRHAPACVADAFCASRLDDGGGIAFGLLPGGLDEAGLLGRATPHPAG